MGVIQVSRVPVVAAALLGSACTLSDVPADYQSRNVPGVIDCSAYPKAPSPASCRNLYESITHPVPPPSVPPRRR